jgi:UDP-glucose 4-epimerase
MNPSAPRILVTGAPRILVTGAPRILVTGASGYIGRLLVAELSGALAAGRIGAVVATDIRTPASADPASADPASADPAPADPAPADPVPADPAAADLAPGVRFVRRDVRDAGLAAVLLEHSVDCVVHLASIVTPPRGSTREFEWSVDVGGTRAVLDACVEARVRRVVVTSSGAAYGYHADNPELIGEDTPLRGNESFAYSWHKRLVEEMLAGYRSKHSALEQVIFRVGTILGASVNNQITALFERRRILVLRGCASPFVFVNDRDVVNCLVRAVDSAATGTFNVAGDGVLPLREIAALLGKHTVEVPPSLLRAALAALHPLGLTRYGPEQLDFLRYRPVLDNRRLKQVFGYTPAMTTREAFLHWRDSR